jgi:hypothetical protein
MPPSVLPARPRRATRISLLLVALSTVLGFVSTPAIASATTGTGSISGTAFQDTNRNGVQDAGEPAMANQGIDLMDASGTNLVAFTSTDANGSYSFTGLSDGTYLVKYDPGSWWAIRSSWVPDTTGSVRPSVTVNLAGSAVVAFGWRPIVRSTDLAAPISSYVGPNGLQVKSYDDVVAAKDIYDDLMSGSIIGPEAATTTVLFDYSTSSDYTVESYTGGPGNYANYTASVYMAYMDWLQGGDQVLFHEYGHAWSLYYAYIVQQDSNLTAYLQARGILGDPRLGTSHAWTPRELIAEDYRQLFGSPNAQAAPQENTDLPPAAAVPWLKTFLATTFQQPPATASPLAPPADTTAPSVSGVASVGSSLTCNAGAWSGAPTYAYAWLRDGSAISGPTAPAYTATSADAGHQLSCSVTATNGAGSATAASSNSIAIPVPAPPTLTSLAMNPNPVKSSGTASVSVSAPTTLTIAVRDASGKLVRTLVSATSEPAGSVSATWNRTNSTGQRVKSGVYTVAMTATDAYGHTVSGSTTFNVS